MSGIRVDLREKRRKGCRVKSRFATIQSRTVPLPLSPSLPALFFRMKFRRSERDPFPPARRFISPRNGESMIPLDPSCSHVSRDSSYQIGFSVRTKTIRRKQLAFFPKIKTANIYLLRSQRYLSNSEIVQDVPCYDREIL